MVTVGRSGQSNFLKANHAPLIVISLLLVGLVECKEIAKVRVLLHMGLSKKKKKIFFMSSHRLNLEYSSIIMNATQLYT